MNDLNDLKRGDWIKANRQGAVAEQVLAVYGTSVVTYAGERYHVTKIVRAAAPSNEHVTE
jgi:hypothetical protein